MRTNPEIDFSYTIIDNNEDSVDTCEALYKMSDDEFEAHLAELHEAKLAGEI